MEPEAKNSRKKRYWQHHIDSWRASGQSQKKYCLSQGLALATFCYWKRKIQKNKAAAKRFYPLTLPEQHPALHESCENKGKLLLHFDHYRLEIGEDFSTQHLKEVIRVLEQVST